MTEDEAMLNRHSDNPAELKRAALRQLLPEVFSEDKLDIAALKRALGESTTVAEGERYRLDWVGKTEAYKTLQATTTATLRPMPEQSVNFASANHVFIEGENLETLKVIQKAYFGQVKLIYIDPPYNTGSDNFVYPDRFQESKEDYLRRINELDEQGALLREGQFRKNSRESGHYHSNWLSMMLPRLYIARNLLKDDGVIFVSCDDNEVFNLRCLMNEIFGEENFVATVIWQKRYSRENRGAIGDAHEYLLVYARDSSKFKHTRGLIKPTEKQLDVYKNPNRDPRGRWQSVSMTAQGYRPNQMYEIIAPNGNIHSPPEGRCWSMTEGEYKKLYKQGRIWFGADGNGVPRVIRYLSEVDGHVPWTWWPAKEVGHTDAARKEIRAALGSQTVFDTPKPVRLIRRILEIASPIGEDDLILDFFAGSGTTMDAVLQQNAEDGGNRRCILVQMAEPLDADNAEFSDIAQVARTRVRRALEKLRASDDLLNKVPAGEGFRAFRLAASCFPQWRPQSFDDADELAEQIRLFMDADNVDNTPQAIVQELLLKSGYPLTTSTQALDIAGTTVCSVDEGKLLLVVEGFNAEMIQPLIDLKPERLIALDAVFNHSDQLKTNLALQCRDAGIGFESV
ncbi:MAG: site-specific DNA-methyltransferase [Wenzhouxiangellaceae bacterium]